MDNITTRAIVIGVGIFVTLGIVSIILISFFQMKKIYNVVANTDNSVYNKFNDVYSMYNGKVVTGIGLLNTIKQYEEEYDTNVIIRYPGYEKIRQRAELEQEREAVYLKRKMEKEQDYKFQEKYRVTVFEEDKNVIINFEKI